MKYKVVVNGTVMCQDVSALRALNCVCGVMQGRLGTPLEVKVYYLSKGEWKLENSFHTEK